MLAGDRALQPGRSLFCSLFPSMSFSVLPDEVLTSILQMCPVLSLLELRFVNRRFRDCITPRLWRHVFFAGHGVLPPNIGEDETPDFMKLAVTQSLFTHRPEGFQPLPTPEKVRCVMLGPDAGGKTTLLYQWKLGEAVTTIPTIGFNVEDVGQRFSIWDVGGNCKIRQLWRHYLEDTHAVLYLVDASDPERFEEAAESFRESLLPVMGPKCLVLILLAKTNLLHGATDMRQGPKDLADPINFAVARRVAKVLRLQELPDLAWQIVVPSMDFKSIEEPLTALLDLKPMVPKKPESDTLLEQLAECCAADRFAEMADEDLLKLVGLCAAVDREGFTRWMRETCPRVVDRLRGMPEDERKGLLERALRDM
eukprot:GAFH01000117.1.p1 GENE.GAFH01000117.1~~GAFH01000117.1.p1  ORF type:complete len:367 (+),score=72.34 GAFH01000117.1:534-1634(+)